MSNYNIVANNIKAILDESWYGVKLTVDTIENEITVSILVLESILLTFYISTTNGEVHNYFQTDRHGYTIKEIEFATLTEVEHFALKTFANVDTRQEFADRSSNTNKLQDWNENNE